MIALYIISAIILLCLALLFLPVDVCLEFKEELKLKIKFSGIKIYTLKEKPKKKPKKEKSSKTAAPQKKKEKPNFFKKLKKKYGFIGSVKLLFGFLKDLLVHIKRLLRHIKFKDIRLNLVVAENDAAETALQYGRVCAAAYPVLSFLDNLANVEYKIIDLSGDFESCNPLFEFSFVVRLKVFFLLVCVFKVYTEYKKFTARIENNERK